MFGIDALVGGGIGLLGAQKNNAANAQMAKHQMDFQERMSNTAHQREVADLRAAGLNPVLSGTGGHGATAPPGAMATMQNDYQAGFASAQEAQRTRATTELQQAEAKGAEARADRDTEIAKIIKQISPKILAGIGGIESGAKWAGQTAAEIAEAIRNFKLPDMKLPPALQRLLDMFSDQPKRPMPAAEAPNPLEVFQVTAKGHSDTPTREARRLQETFSGTTTKSARERGVNWRKRPMRD